jgi:predicted nuclease of predicted toxin-antitoxin system
MRVLLDNNVNYRFGRLLKGHEVVHVQDIGWDKLRNGELLAAADRDGFEVMITADKRMQYQQPLSGRRVSIIVLNALFLKWPYIEPLAPQVQAALSSPLPVGSFITINSEG